MVRARAAFAIAFAACVATFGCSNESGPAVAVEGVALYGQMCARCHGTDGRGDAEMKKVLPKIRDFSEPDFRGRRPEQIERTIMAGKDQMPAFGGALSPLKIQHLAGYVRRLSAGPTAPGK